MATYTKKNNRAFCLIELLICLLIFSYAIISINKIWSICVQVQTKTNDLIVNIDNVHSTIESNFLEFMQAQDYFKK